MAPPATIPDSATASPNTTPGAMPQEGEKPIAMRAGGPCPPQGNKPHRYIFTVYAVDEDKLQFAKDHNVSAAVVGFELHFHSKAKASLTATYGR